MNQPDSLSGIFSGKYPDLSGKDWIRRVDPDDRAVFVQIGHAAAEYGRKGGFSRAASARRDWRGRFIPNKGPAPVQPTPDELERERAQKYGISGIDF